MIAMHHINFSLVCLNHRYRYFLAGQRRLQRIDLCLIAAFKYRQLRLRSCKFCQLAIDFWRGDTGGKPQDELAAMEKVMPGWCQFLTACRSGRYVLISREEAISNSFASLGLMAAQIQSQIAGRPLPEAK